MGYIEGLVGVKETLAKKETGDYADRVKATWLSLKDKDAVKIVFLQELDKDSPNYSEKNGLAKFFLEHSNPANWRKKAECTINEGSCYGCSNGWAQKVQLYINVLVDDGVKDPYVAVLSRGTGKGSVAKQLLEIAGDKDFNNSISDKLFKFSRSGSTKDDTTYTLAAMGEHKVNVESYELFDLTEAVFHVKPEKQEDYYSDGQAPAAPAQPVSASSISADW